MKCPICEVELVMSDRQGVEIDYCPKCRGIWLDRGELDKIIEKNLPSYGQNNNIEDQKRDDNNDNRKKEGFLGNLFDF